MILKVDLFMILIKCWTANIKLYQCFRESWTFGTFRENWKDKIMWIIRNGNIAECYKKLSCRRERRDPRILS